MQRPPAASISATSGASFSPVPAPGEDGVAARREAARDGRADEVAGADYGDGGVAWVVHRGRLLVTA